MPFPARAPGIWKARPIPPETIGAGDTLGLRIGDKATGKYFYFLAACAGVTDDLKSRLAGAPLVFFDGTVWRDDELIVAGLGSKTGQGMGHIAMSGDHGAIESLAGLDIGRKIFLHINNSNPALLHDSAEREAVERAGWQIPADGMEITVVNAKTANAMTAFSIGGSLPLNNAEELEAALRHIGATRYHNLHPFHRLLHGGKLNKGQVQAWALNRYYYQSTIPLKDAVVISRFRDRGIRIEWRHRIEDHDGDLGTEGGIERWLKLTEGLGLDSAYVESAEGILPATRFAVDAYVHFVRDKTPLEAIASSLTELFAPNLHEERIAGMLAHYDFVNPDIMSYFSRRMEQAPRDANFALDFVKTHAKTPAEREAVCNALLFKTNVLMGSARRAVSCLCRRPRAAGSVCSRRQIEATAEAMAGRNISVSETSRPVLPRHARLKFDETRQVWVILAPERVLAPDEIAVEVLQLCDGVRSVEQMIDQLAEKYTADRAAIATDVIAMLQDLADKGFLTEAREKTS